MTRARGEVEGVMDEVARERASAAHARLDGINGQIVGLRVSQDKTRDELVQEIADTRGGIYEAMGKLWDAHNDAARQMSEMRGTLGLALKVAGAVGFVMLTLLGSLLGWVVTHQAAPRNTTGTAHKATGARGVEKRLAAPQRGAHERLAGP